MPHREIGSGGALTAVAPGAKGAGSAVHRAAASCQSLQAPGRRLHTDALLPLASWVRTAPGWLRCIV